MKTSSNKHNKVKRSKKDNDGLYPRTETIESFLNRGGTIKKCPPMNADMCIPGTAYFDGDILINVLGEPEYVPNYIIDEKTWNFAQNERPDVLSAYAWREKEYNSLPLELRKAKPNHAEIDL